MYVFLMPWLAVGARNTLVEAPDPADLLHRIEADGHGAFFAAPALWVALVNHPEFTEKDLSSLRKAYYGASIMPGPVLDKLRSALPELGFYNCFGQSEIGPLATVLRPEEHADRIKDVISTGGVLVASREIEDVLFAHPDVAEAAVVGVADDKWIEAVTAYVVPAPGADREALPDLLVAHVRERLAPFKVPKAVRVVSELPRNASGRILKRELRDRDA